MRSIDDLASDLQFTTATTGEGRTVTFLPEPEPAERRSTRSSRSTTTSSSRPHTFEGRVPARFADRAPRVVEHGRRRARRGCTTASELPNVGFNAVVGRPVERVQLRARPLRRDAQGRVGHPRARPRHGPQRRLRVAELPVVPARLRRPAAPDDARPDRDLAEACVRAWNDWHLEEWAGHLPRPHHPVPDPVAARPRGRRADEIRAQRRARASRRYVPRAARTSSACRRCTRGHWDPFMRRLRRDRHGRLPAHRLVGHVAVHHRRRPARRRRRAVLRLRDVRRGRLAVLEDRRCASPTSGSACPRAASAGWPACSTASTTCSATTRCTARGAASTSRRPR